MLLSYYFKFNSRYNFFLAAFHNAKDKSYEIYVCISYLRRSQNCRAIPNSNANKAFVGGDEICKVWSYFKSYEIFAWFIIEKEANVPHAFHSDLTF
jgi:hypothetical protein